MSVNIKLHKDDLPANLNFGPVVACDCEFTGLNPPKDKLCLIQLLSIDSKQVHIVQFVNRDNYNSPNLVKFLGFPQGSSFKHEMERIFDFLSLETQTQGIPSGIDIYELL